VRTTRVGIAVVDERSEGKLSHCGRFLGENRESAGGRQLGRKEMERGTYVFEVSDRCVLGGHGDSTVC
jgi:hypothetical protein